MSEVSINRRLVAGLCAGLVVATMSTVAPAQQRSPADWLDLMTTAVATTNYQGTVIRRKRGNSEALKVVHRIVDGVVNERITSQEGNGLEIIRIGNDVHSILPDKRSVLIEGWKRDRHPKVEAWREATGRPPIAPGDATIRAVAAKGNPGIGDRPVLDLDDTASIADLITAEIGL